MIQKRLGSSLASLIGQRKVCLPIELAHKLDESHWVSSTTSLQLSAVSACQIMIQIVTALQYTHHMGYVHADIKADNICQGSSMRKSIVVVCSTVHS